MATKKLIKIKERQMKDMIGEVKEAIFSNMMIFLTLQIYVKTIW